VGIGDPNELVEELNCFGTGDGVPRDTDRNAGLAEGDEGDGRTPEGEALYRGGVSVSFGVVAMGVISVSS
jgi:hypothetical protein